MSEKRTVLNAQITADTSGFWRKVGQVLRESAEVIKDVGVEVLNNAGPIMEGYSKLSQSRGDGSSVTILNESSGDFASNVRLGGGGLVDLGSGTWKTSQLGDTNFSRRSNDVGSVYQDYQTAQRETALKVEKAAKSSKLPASVLKDSNNQSVDLWQKLQQGQPLDKRERGQVAHTLEVESYKASTPHQEQKVQELKEYAGQQQMRNEVWQQYDQTQERLKDRAIAMSANPEHARSMGELLMEYAQRMPQYSVINVANQTVSSWMKRVKESTFESKMQVLREASELIVSNGSLDDVDKMQAIMRRAALLAGDNTEQFILLMNEMVIGNNQALHVLDLAWTPPRRYPRFNIGDIGMNPIYRDGENTQMSHFWGLVNYGYYWRKDFAKAANVWHEDVEGLFNYHFKGQLNKASKQDLRLSALAINIGKALKNKNLAPLELVQKLDTILRTTEYNVLSSKGNIWLELLPEASPEE